MTELRDRFGSIDIYLFDLFLRGQIRPTDGIFDAGCGFGRNLHYALTAGHEVFGVDVDPEAVATVRALAARLAPGLPPENFAVEPIESASFPGGGANVVISSAVLHFARDGDHFERMLLGTWRVLAPGGLFFCRLASTIGIESRVRLLDQGTRRYRLPDGTDRYLVEEADLRYWTEQLGGDLVDPVKTTLVQDQRAMTTWVMRRRR